VRLAVVFVVLTATRAFAEPAPDAFLTIAPGPPPELRAEVIGAKVSAADCVITDGDAHVVGERVTPYDPAQTVAIMFVVAGDEIFGGGQNGDNNEYDPYAGDNAGLVQLAKAIDHFAWKRLGPPGSTFEIVDYATGAEIKKPKTPLGELDGAAFGSRKDYAHRIGIDLVQGITLGLAELAHTTAGRKVLVVAGDGNDTNNELARDALAELARKARREGVETVGIIWKASTSELGDVLHFMIPDARVVSSTDGAVTELAAMNARTTERQTVTFAAGLDWNGQRHHVRLKCPGIDLDSSLVFAAWEPASKSAFPRYLLIGCVLVLAIGIYLARRR
jgi:hypothetical protein